MSARQDHTSELTLVDQLLAEQQRLTAVERFSHWHGRAHSTDRYSHLMPVTPPGPGEQYRFEVNLDACTGCKACVSACHALNGLDDDEAWRDVGLLLGGQRNAGYQQTVTSACHHCADPACANGCPVAAYEKEADTGIVRHLDDQCIGCQYCVLKCPYDVPKYNEKLGIVRKCDMCVGRLREGEAPACVQACPTSAIRIRVVRQEELTFTTGTRLLPGAFDSSYTRPATAYRTSKVVPRNTQPADAKSLRLEHAHWPLIWMLVLTQMGAGMFFTSALLLWLGQAANDLAVYGAAALLFAGLGISMLHLGRPLGAWRFFLGLRKSWMSREILAFTLFAGAAKLACAAAFFNRYQLASTSLAAVLGLVAVFTSVMIYVDTRRPFWNYRLTAGKFYGTSFILGLTALAAIQPSMALIIAALIARTVLVAWEQVITRRAFEDDESPWHLSARVLKHRLWRVCDIRDACYTLAVGVCLHQITLSGAPALASGVIVLLLSVTQRVLERYTFFTAAMGPRMTGGYQP